MSISVIFPDYLRDAPNRADDNAKFNTDMAYALDYFSTYYPDLGNQWSDEANTLAAEVNNNAIIAKAAANYQGDWSLTPTLPVVFPYPIGVSVTHTSKQWASKIASNSEEPGTGSQWLEISTGEIDDAVTSLVKTWSSTKIDAEIKKGIAKNYATATGTASAIVLATPEISAYEDNQTFFFQGALENPGAMTVNINGIGIIDVVIDNSPLTGGEVLPKGFYSIVYNSANSNGELKDIQEANKQDLNITIVTAGDTDRTLTDEEQKRGTITIDTSSWSGTRQIIMNKKEHTFLAIVTGGNSAEFINVDGTGTTVPSGGSKDLRNNTVNVEIRKGGLDTNEDLTIGQEITIDSWSFIGTEITINTAVPHKLTVGKDTVIKGLLSTTNTPFGVYAVTTVEDTDTITVTALATPTGSPTVSSATLSSGGVISKGLTRLNGNRFKVSLGTIVNDDQIFINYPIPNTKGDEWDVRVQIEIDGVVSGTGFGENSNVDTTGFGVAVHANENQAVVTTGQTFVYFGAPNGLGSGFPNHDSIGRTSAPAWVTFTYIGVPNV